MKKRNLLLELHGKIQAIANAEALDYDGDEGPHAQARQLAGIELDDFVMEHYEGLLTELERALSSATLDRGPSGD